MIRTATLTDLSAIRALMEHETGFWNPAWTDAHLERALQSAGKLALVWEDGGRLLGFACAHDLGFRAYLSELVVDPQARGQGIARQLIEAIQAELAQRGCPVLIADVWKNAVGFYQSLGWSPPDVILLRKKLLP